MSIRRQLDAWLAAGAISSDQHREIDRLVRRGRLSVFVELNAMLYLGVIAIAGGLAWTARTYSEQWGDLAILGPATALAAGCLYFCFTRAAPYTPEHVEAPTLAFDYALYLACLVFAVELAYVEYRFQLLQARWDRYLLGSAIAYFSLAYRFDNRFVLSLAIGTLGGWFGVHFSRWMFVPDASIRVTAIVYGAFAAAVGVALYRAGIKKHFLETYLHVAANVLLAALTAGTLAETGPSPWIIGLLALAAVTIAGGARFRRFAFVVYGVGYGYIGLSGEILGHVRGLSATLTYFVISASVVVASLVGLSRRFARDS